MQIFSSQLMKIMYDFNDWLLMRVHVITGVTRNEINRYLGKGDSYMRDLRRLKNGIKVVDLLKICDLCRIPVGYFFCRESEIGTYREFRGEYRSAKLRIDAIERLMRGELGSDIKVSGKTMLRFLNHEGVESQARVNWYKDGQSTITTRELARLCNEMKLDMNVIIDDPLHLLPALYTKSDFDRQCRRIYDSELNMLATLKKNRAPHRDRKGEKISKLEARLAELEKQNQQLQRENDRLRRERLPDIGLAADGAAPYIPEKK